MKSTFTQSLFFTLLRASLALLSGLLFWLAAAATSDVHILPITSTIILLVIGSFSFIFYPVLRRFLRRLQRGYDADASRGKVSLPLFLLLLGGIVSCGTIQAQVSGAVFRDFNGNGTKDTNEPLVSGVLVSAYLANSNTPCGTATSSGTTAPNFSVAGCGTADVRVEFEIPTSGTCVNSSIEFSSLSGTTYGSSVQFVQGNSTNINFGLNNPADYNQGVSTTTVFTPRHVNGDPLAAGVGSTSGSYAWFFGFPYSSTGTTTPPLALDGTTIGATWGVTYSKQAKLVFASAFVKRHTGLGTIGSGGIYILTPTATSFTVGTFFDMDNNSFNTAGTPVTRTRADGTAPAYGVGSSYQITDLNSPTRDEVTFLGGLDPLTGKPSGLGVVGTNPARGLVADPLQLNYDPAGFDQIGKVGIGSIAISDDGKYLFVLNLYSKKVFRLTLNDPYTPTAITAVTSYDIPNPGCNNGEFRPFASKFYRGKLYVGGVCSGENGGQNIVNGATDLYAYAYELNNATGAASFNATPVISYPLNYQKGPVRDNQMGASRGDFWSPWTNQAGDVLEGNTHPTPMLTDISFTDNGDMIMDFTDRSGDQYGEENYKFLKDETFTTSYIIGGDILIAGRNCTTGNFTLENNGSFTSSNGQVYSGIVSANAQGPGNSEFFQGETYRLHQETSIGAVTVLNGTGEILITSMDPRDYDSGGVKHLSQTNGAELPSDWSGYELYGQAPFFSKANGLGDIEILSVPAPLEIGNRVWMDTDDDGIQDAGEMGIGSIPVKLYLGGVLVGATTTSSDGTFYFNNSNVNLNGATGLLPNTAYIIRIDAADFPSGKSLSTNPNIGGAGQPDVRDNDATLNAGNAEIAVTTGNYGENNHTLDMAFRLPTCALTAISFANTSSCNNNGTNASATDDYFTADITVTFSNPPATGNLVLTGDVLQAAVLLR